MTVDLLNLLHQALFGGLAASGFGILFNFGWRDLPWCATSGALALAVRTLGQDAGWNLEAASSPRPQPWVVPGNCCMPGWVSAPMIWPLPVAFQWCLVSLRPRESLACTL